MGLRKLKRQVAHAQMEQVGVVQPNRTHYKHVDRQGNPTTVTRKSFFASHWKDTRG